MPRRSGGGSGGGSGGLAKVRLERGQDIAPSEDGARSGRGGELRSLADGRRRVFEGPLPPGVLRQDGASGPSPVRHRVLRLPGAVVGRRGGRHPGAVPASARGHHAHRPAARDQAPGRRPHRHPPGPDDRPPLHPARRRRQPPARHSGEDGGGPRGPQAEAQGARDARHRAHLLDGAIGGVASGDRRRRQDAAEREPLVAART